MVYTHKLSTSKDDIILEILDTGSQPSHEIVEKHVRWGDGFILLYSLTDKNSLSHLKNVKDIIEKFKGCDSPLVLVGNKSDLMSARQVAEDETVEMAGKFDYPRFEISVADGSQGVQDVMEELLCLLKRDFIKNLNTGNIASMESKPKSKLYSMKKAFKKRINRSHSDTF